MLFLWLASLWIWLFWSCAADWSQEDFQFGWLVPPLAAYFLWHRLAPLTFSAPSLPATGALALLGIGFLVGPLELLRMAPLPWRLLLWAIFFLAASATWIVGRMLLGRQVGQLFFPLLFVALAVPWPSTLEWWLTGDLAQFLASATAGTLQWFGTPAQAAGKTVSLEHCVVGIEQACSGMRSLQSSMLLSLGIGELLRVSLGGRALLIVFGLALASVENFLRLLAMCVLGNAGGSPLIDRWHDPAGWLGFIVLAAGIYGLGLILPTTKESQKNSPPSSLTLPVSVSRWAYWGMGVSLAGFLAAHAWFSISPSFQGSDESRLLPRTSELEKVAVPEAILESLRPSEGGYYQLLALGKRPVLAYHFFWKTGRRNPMQLFHRPDACMPGAGWVLQSPPVRLDLLVSREPVPWWKFVFDRNGERLEIIWTAFVADQPMHLTWERAIHLHRDFLWEMIGRRLWKPDYEVAAIILPSSGEEITAEEAQRAVEQVFQMRPPAPAQKS